MADPTGTLIKRGVDLLLLIIVAKAIGPLDGVGNVIGRFYALPEISQVGVVTLLVIVGSHLAAPLPRLARAGRATRRGRAPIGDIAATAVRLPSNDC